MKQLSRMKDDLVRFGVLLIGALSALVLYIISRTYMTLILSFICFAVLVILMLKLI